MASGPRFCAANCARDSACHPAESWRQNFGSPAFRCWTLMPSSWRRDISRAGLGRGPLSPIHCRSGAPSRTTPTADPPVIRRLGRRSCAVSPLSGDPLEAWLGSVWSPPAGSGPLSVRGLVEVGYASQPGAAAARDPPCRSAGSGALPQCNLRLPSHRARGTLRAAPDHGGLGVAAGAGDYRAGAARPRGFGMDRRAWLSAHAVCSHWSGLPAGSGSSRRGRAWMLPRAFAGRRKARAAFVTPSHQYPLGSTMSASRRLAAARLGATLRRLDRGGRLRQRIPL